MKKIISSVLLVAFCLFSFWPNPVSADPAMSVQRATEIAKSLITIPKDIKDFRSNYSEYNGRGVWELSWETEDGMIHVSVDALSGEINQYHQYLINSEPNNTFPTINRKGAIKIANEFLARAVPARYPSLKIIEPDNYEVYSYNNPNITLNYQRMVNSVPYAQNGAFITVSGVTGEILSYSINWDYDLDFKAPTGIITKEKAEGILKDNAFELIYYKPYDSKDKVLLVYGIRNANNSFVDAHTGEYHEALPYYRFMAEKSMVNFDLAVQEGLSPIELKEIDTIKGLISKEEAINIVKKHIAISDDFKLTHSNLYQDYQNKDMRRWSFDWQSDSGEYTKYISAAVDARSGELLYFYKPNYSPDRQKQEANYSYEQAKKIAEDFINFMQPQKAKQIKINEGQQQRILKEIKITNPQNDVKEVGFEYIRLVNGIPFYDDKFNLTVDLISGEVIYYNCNWSNLKFPAPDKIINKEEAFKKLTNENLVKLEYIQPSEFYITEASHNKKVGLYYHLSNSEPKLVDAFKGTVLKNNGEEFKKKVTPSFTDITGHPAEDDINTLLSLGIITGNDKGLFLPNNNITNAEFIKMLVLAIGAFPGEGKKIDSLGNEWYSPYYQTALNRRIIDKDNMPSPNEHLTRLNAAHMLIRAMNLGYVADLQGIYKLSATDAKTVKSKDIGYIAISTELGLLPLKNNQVRINEVMQRGESATTIVKLIKVYKK